MVSIRFTFIILILLTQLQILSAESVEIPRIEGEITLDGNVNEAAWQSIPPLKMVQHTPVFGKEPTESLEVRVGYNKNFLYVSGRLFVSDPSQIRGLSKKRDAFTGTIDYFGILIDSFNDNENGLAFFTSPTGLRFDATVFNDGEGDLPVNVSWNTFWDAATSQDEDGWYAELRIPFSSLRFQDDNGKVTMGMTLWRFMPAKNEVDVYPAISQEWGNWSLWKPSQTQDVSLENVFSKKPLYLAPYVLGGYQHSFELTDDETDYLESKDPTFEAGLDLKYGITSNLTLDVTINTDFAQVEADDQQVNLTRFSLFFPEKRLFFQERASIFDFNFEDFNRLFYSRQIGIYEEDPVRIYGGARIVGRLGSSDIGFLSMQTASIDSLNSENFSVLRFRRQAFNENSYIGAMLTNRVDFKGKFNTAYGLDAVIRVFGNDYFTARWTQSFENDRPNKFASLDHARIYLNWTKRKSKGFAYNLTFSRAGKDYVPGMGFELREDFTSFQSLFSLGFIPNEESKLIKHSFFLYGFAAARNAGFETESAGSGFGWGYESKSNINGFMALNYAYENIDESFELSDEVEIPVGAYRFVNFDGNFNTPFTAVVAAELHFNLGQFYDGGLISVGISPRWTISSSFELTGTYQLNTAWFPSRDERFNAHVGRLRFEYMMNTKFSASTFIQYNGGAKVYIGNLRLRYNPKEGNDLYVVYNADINTDLMRETPYLPNFNSQVILVKYTHTFRL